MNQTIPKYLASFFPEILSNPVTESLATCDDCRMAKAPIPRTERYQANLKCCTFWPDLSNHQIGALLLAKQVNPFLFDCCEDLHRANPMGLPASYLYQQNFLLNKNQFGKNTQYLCPYYDTQKNNCGIWNHRGAVCTGYFCISDRGEAGMAAWQALTAFQQHLETQLAQWVLPDLGLSKAQMELCFTAWDSRQSDCDFLSLWQDLETTPREFYQKSYQCLQSFDPELINEVLGDFGLHLKQDLLEKFLVFRG